MAEAPHAVPRRADGARFHREPAADANSARGDDEPAQISRGRDSIDYNYGNQTDVTVDFSTWGVGHTVVTGFELIDETSQNLGRTIPMAVAADLFRPNPDTPYTGRIFYNGSSTQVNVRTAAAFIVDTIKLTPEWELVGGLRYDHIKSESDARAATTLAVTNLTSYDNFVSGQGSVVYKPLPNGSVYFSYANSFNPSAKLFALAATQVNLDPEENNSYEVGTKWDVFDKKLALTLAVFRIDKTNARQTVGDEVQLVGATRSQGIEFGFSGEIMPTGTSTAATPSSTRRSASR